MVAGSAELRVHSFAIEGGQLRLPACSWMLERCAMRTGFSGQRLKRGIRVTSGPQPAFRALMFARHEAGNRVHFGASHVLTGVCCVWSRDAPAPTTIDQDPCRHETIARNAARRRKLWMATMFLEDPR
jgi:hypothetical protein